MDTIDVQYFSDVMCVWAYVAQARLDELKENFADKISVSYRFVSVYGNTQQRVLNHWKEKGGVAAYIDFVRGVANEFGHVTISDNFWRDGIGPKSSASVHCFLKAIAHLVQAKQIDNGVRNAWRGKTLYEEAIWQCRKRYFCDGLNIGLLNNQLTIAQELGLDPAQIRSQLDNGAAFAALCEDNELKEKYNIEGSPTYLLNEGRQKLYGNVGYKIIAANIEELINRPQGVASWC